MPAQYRTKQGFKLGSWIGKQRSNKNSLNLERKNLLENLGFAWDANIAQWNQGYEELKKYVKEFNSALVPSEYLTKDGFNLGSWVVTQRAWNKKTFFHKTEKNY